MSDYRPSWDEYFMRIARTLRRLNCLRRKVGALIVKQRNIISTGYNGTPIGVKNCFEGGCPRCQSDVEPGQGYDTVSACTRGQRYPSGAPMGTRLEGGVLYTRFAFFLLLKEAVQAGIQEIVFESGEPYEGPLEDAYQMRVPIRV